MKPSFPASDQDDRSAWKRWLALMAAMTALATLIVLAFVVLVDPFSTGRLTTVRRIDVITGNRLYDSVARIRNQSFDAAIIGTSVAVRISPVALDQATGRRFVVLAIEGTWPFEHAYLMREFDRGRTVPVFTVALDDAWCSPTLGHGPLLPRWLFGNSNIEYLGRILSPFSVRMAWRRLRVMYRFAAGERPDGLEPAPWVPPGRERMRREMETMSPSVDAADADAPFPYLDELERSLGQIGPRGIVLLVFTPVYAKHLPVPGSRADARLRACKSRAEAMARARPGSGVLDLRVDGPKVRDIDNFTDMIHYKAAITRDVEAAIAQRLNEMLRVASR